jgi:hypothetical protein
LQDYEAARKPDYSKHIVGASPSKTEAAKKTTAKKA